METLGCKQTEMKKFILTWGKKKVKCEKTEVELKKRKDQLGWQKERT